MTQTGRDRMDGKVALITGGGTGLGLKLALELAARGARIAICSRNPDHLEAGLRAVTESGGSCSAFECDVRDVHAVRRTVRRTVEECGGLDFLVNNAAGNFVRPSERLPEKAFANVVDIVLNGTFYASRAAARGWIERGRGGVILNVVATYAWTGGPGTLHSACAKAGVLAMTRTLAVEWARHRIRVVAIAPGPFESRGAADRLWPDETFRKRILRGIPAGRFAERGEVAKAAAWLLSSEAEYITGECLTMDGGAWLGRGIHGRPDEDIPIIRRRRSSAAARKREKGGESCDES